MPHNKPLAALLGLAILSLATPALAAEAHAFEAMTAATMGGPIGLAFTSLEHPSTTAPFVVAFAERLRSHKYSGVGLELSYVPGHGYGANLLIDVVKTEGFRLHLLDLGIFRNQWQPVTVSRLERSVDVTGGLGAEIKFANHSWLTIDGRVFVPDPLFLNKKYQFLARPYFDESLKGVMLWIGYGLSF